MDGQNFMNFSQENTGLQVGQDNLFSSEREKFKEIFATDYGVHNLKYLKEGYLYFDKYGKQRKIDFAVFTKGKKLAVICSDWDKHVLAEYQDGDKQIIESSLNGQGWETWFFKVDVKDKRYRKDTSLDLKRFIGAEPSFMEYMENVAGEKPTKNHIVPVIIIIALIASAVLFPKISDKLFSSSVKEEASHVEDNIVEEDIGKIGPRKTGKNKKEFDLEDF